MGYKTTGINQVKYFTRPICHSVLAIAGNATYIIHNSFSLFQQTVEQSAFSHIGSSNNCNSIAHNKTVKCSRRLAVSIFFQLHIIIAPFGADFDKEFEEYFLTNKCFNIFSGKHANLFNHASLIAN